MTALWPQLTDRERRMVCAWESIAQRLEAARNTAHELKVIASDYALELRGLSRSSIFRKVAAYRTYGPEGILSKRTLRRCGKCDGSALPAAFITYWRARCAGMQRDKVLPVWHALMRDLRAGLVVPGYDCDWRGIYLAEHPKAICPSHCPYSLDHRHGKHPRGWSYRNLKSLAPEADVQAACSRGVAALRQFLPSVPHTRVGLGPMQVITMDDVWHDVEVLFLHGRKQPTHERPVEVGVMDVLTGCHVCWTLWPVLRTDEGKRHMVEGYVQRYIQATLFCGIGIHPEGLIELLEHGTAGLSESEVNRLNAILARYQTPPACGQWLTVQRSSTTGAPLIKGLFVERACGNPRHKAMLESSWNLLHNALATLPAATGKDIAHAPADAEGLRREDRALMALVQKAAKAHPEALETLRKAEFHAVSFLKFKEALAAVKHEINHRTDHTLEGWEKCGFIRHIAHLPGGAELDLEAVPPEKCEQTAALIRALNAPVRLRPMSPAEAFQHATQSVRLVRFPIACAMEILGEELAERQTVSRRGTLCVRDRFSEEMLTYSAIARTADGRTIELTRKATYRVWQNPFERQGLLVADENGCAIGVCPLLEASAYGDTTSDIAQKNLGLWQEAASHQRKRLEPLLTPKKQRKIAVTSHIAQLVSDVETRPTQDIQNLAQWAQFTEAPTPCAVKIEDFL
jgi:hypothetical protein